MVERIRCPHCSTVFPATARPRCPGCGLVGRIQPGAVPRPPVSRVRRDPSRDRVVAAVAVAVLLLAAGVTTVLVLDRPGSPPTADLNGGPGPDGGDGGAGGASGDGNGSAPPANVDVLRPNATVGGSGPEGTAPPAFSFEGSGDDVTDDFTTEQGLLRVHMTYFGDGFFRAAFINLDDENATRRSLSAPQGDYEGTRYVGLAPGRYIVDVTSGDASAAWSVTIEQPRAPSADAVPRHATGRGDAAVPALSAEGEVTFHAAHTSPVGEFVVRLYDAHGNLVRRGDSEAIVSAYGDHAASVRVALPAAGVYFVDVQAVGDWSIEVTR